MPVRLVELLARRRGIELVEVPDEEFESMGCNVLALGPRVALALDGNPETRRRLEAAGVDVRVYRARSSRGRATAGRPASRARSNAAEHEVDGLLGSRRAVDALELPARVEDHDRPAEQLRERDLGQRAPAAADGDHGVARGRDGEVRAWPSP